MTKIVESWQLLHSGSAEAFIDALSADALAHPAVNHPYLQRLASGELPDTSAAIRDYCHQYWFYSAEFVTYLNAVIDGLQSQTHQNILQENLNEELGQDEEGNPDCIPHTELFQRFRKAAGVTADYEAENAPCTTVSVWHDLFLQKCRSKQAGVGVGAIGIGTEMVVSSVYKYLHQAVTRHTEMTADDYLFLTLHLDCDDQHADDLKQISVDMADSADHREALRFGVLSSLNLRNTFWDVMLARATTL